MIKPDTDRLCEHWESDIIEGKLIHCENPATVRVRKYTEMEALQDDGTWKKEPRPDEYLCDKHFDQKCIYGTIKDKETKAPVPADGTWTFRRIKNPNIASVDRS